MMETINLECKPFLEDQSNYRLNELTSKIILMKKYNINNF